jgi:hypothetical protein
LLKVSLSDPSERPEGFLVVLPRVHYHLKESPAQAPTLIVSWVVVPALRLFSESLTAPLLVLVQVLESEFDSDLDLQPVQ